MKSVSTHHMKRLWPHQARAVRFAIKHLRQYSTPCLIRMPTGTGKTGIVATLTMIAADAPSLVLTPWKHLRDQMVDDLEKSFWNAIESAPPKVQVAAITPSTTATTIEESPPQVLVSTFQSLNQLRNDYKPVYDKLAEYVSLIIVDEGHYEPAVKWGKSVKLLRSPTVLLTATPYRNDLKLFRITEPDKFTHHYTHQAAVSDNIIRNVVVKTLEGSGKIDDMVLSFSREWRAANAKGSLPSREPRAIVTCRTHSDIKKTVSILRKEGVDAIGIHERFAHLNENYFLKEVPRPNEVDSSVWVHQHKLTEGLDDHRFCALVVLTRIANDRRLVQQVGRILRRNKNDRKKPALIFSSSEMNINTRWSAYLEFETQLALLSPKHYRKVVESLLSQQPTAEYFDGRFRRRFDPKLLKDDPQVIIPPSVLVRSSSPNFELAQYIEDCTDTLSISDVVMLGPEIYGPCVIGENFALWVYASFRNSRHLADRSLYEIKLETHCVHQVGHFIVMADSKGNYPRDYLESNTMPVPVANLGRFLNDSFRPTNVSVDSSIPFDTVMRGSQLRGSNLLRIPVTLTDRTQICRSARGTSTDEGRRYIGMHTGRLRKEPTERERQDFDLATFLEWSKIVCGVLQSEKKPSPVFSRFMQTCDPPSRLSAKICSIDLLRPDVLVTNSDGVPCEIISGTTEVETRHGNDAISSISLEFKGQDKLISRIVLQLDYQSERKCFWFTKESGDTIRVESDGVTDSKSFADFLNSRQDIVLICLDDGITVYQGRRFYEVDYSFAESALLNLIHRPNSGIKCSTEKGTTSQRTEAKANGVNTFPTNSLFNLIDTCAIDFPFSDDVVICDDMGTECADFVFASFENKQIALVHAKVGSGAKVAASTFHDIVAQGMKNLVYLTRNTETPKNVSRWRQGAKWNSTGVEKIRRLSGVTETAGSLWKRIRNEILQSTNPSLYVVLVTSGCCDKQMLKEAVEVPEKRTAETAQLVHLLDGLNGYARQLGVQLLIYDIPYAN